MDVLGIDLAKLSFDATLLTSSGEQHYASFPNSPEGFAQLHTWLLQHDVATLHACMEATNTYFEALATWLHAHDYTVSVVNPARIKGYAMATMQRNKTDKLDSALIASGRVPNTSRLPGSQQLRSSGACAHWYAIGTTCCTPNSSSRTGCVTLRTHWCGTHRRTC